MEELKTNVISKAVDRPKSARAPLEIARPTTSTLVVNVSVQNEYRPILSALFAEVRKRVPILPIDFRVDASGPADVLLIIIGRSGERMDWGPRDYIYRGIQDLQKSPARSNTVFFLTLQQSGKEKPNFDPSPPAELRPQYAALGCSEFFTTTVDVPNRRLDGGRKALRGLLRFALRMEAHIMTRQESVLADFISPSAARMVIVLYSGSDYCIPRDFLFHELRQQCSFPLAFVPFQHGQLTREFWATGKLPVVALCVHQYLFGRPGTNPIDTNYCRFVSTFQPSPLSLLCVVFSNTEDQSKMPGLLPPTPMPPTSDSQRLLSAKEAAAKKPEDAGFALSMFEQPLSNPSLFGRSLDMDVHAVAHVLTDGDDVANPLHSSAALNAYSLKSVGAVKPDLETSAVSGSFTVRDFNELEVRKLNHAISLFATFWDEIICLRN